MQQQRSVDHPLTVVLDDDPTGTQSATDVPVLFEWDREGLEAALAVSPSVYVLTNTRSLPEPEAVAVVREIRDNATAVAERLGRAIRFVLRGDSTLRGHVFAESALFMGPDAVLVFVPAFPEVGRRTLANVHYVEIDGVEVPAHRTEFAKDPVFSFSSETLADYVRDRSDYTPVEVGLQALRDGGLSRVLIDAPPGSVVLPDVATDRDIERIRAGIVEAENHGRRIVVRCGAPLAAALAGVPSTAPFIPAGPRPSATLLVCGSHTAASSAQLKAVEARWGAAVTLDTDAALTDPDRAGRALAAAARARLETSELIIISSARERRREHGTLEHGKLVMEALTTAVRELLPFVDLVLSKGGITSAEVARVGIGARSALVRGQVVPGISVWSLHDRAARRLDYVVIPGNVGSEHTIVDVLGRFGVTPPSGADPAVPAIRGAGQSPS